MRLRFLSVLAVAAMVGLTVPAFAEDGQASLADVAKQKSATKAKHVITDDDIAPSSGAASASASAGNSATASSNSADPKASDAGSSGTAASDKPTAAALEKDLSDVVHDEELLKKDLRVLRQKADKATDPFRKQMYEDSIANQQVTLQEFAKKRKELEKEIAKSKSKS